MDISKLTIRALVMAGMVVAGVAAAGGSAGATPPPGYSDEDYVTDYRHWADCENQAAVYQAQGIDAKCVPAGDFWHEADLYVRR